MWIYKIVKFKWERIGDSQFHWLAHLFLAGCPVLVVPTDHQKHIDHLEVINDWKLLISATNCSILVERKCFKLFLYSPELTSSSMFSSSTRPWAQFKPLEMLSVLPLTNVFAVIKRRRRKLNAKIMDLIRRFRIFSGNLIPGRRASGHFKVMLTEETFLKLLFVLLAPNLTTEVLDAAVSRRWKLWYISRSRSRQIHSILFRFSCLALPRPGIKCML